MRPGKEVRAQRDAFVQGVMWKEDHPELGRRPIDSAGAEAVKRYPAQPDGSRRLKGSERTERSRRIGLASAELGMCIGKLYKQYDLTRIEMMAAVAENLNAMAHYEIRDQWGGE